MCGKRTWSVVISDGKEWGVMWGHYYIVYRDSMDSEGAN